MSDYKEKERKRKSRNPYEDTHPYKLTKQLRNGALKTWKMSEERCVICGAFGSTSREHVPPQSIYSKTPNDVEAVRACSKCQASPDSEFAEFLASYCLHNGATESSKNLYDHKVETSQQKNINKKYSKFILEKTNIRKVLIKQDNGLIIPALAGDWPPALHDPIILKLVHGYYWLLTKGKFLVMKKEK